MHAGRFVASPAGVLAPALHAVAAQGVDRRQWLRALALGGLGLAAGHFVPRAWAGSGGAAAAPTSTPGGAPTAEGDLGWALDMVRRPDADLLHAAGELEMVAARHREAGGLIAVFERMLDLALFGLGAEAAQLDIAGACALRSLQRLGASSLAIGRGEEIRALRDRPLTAAALELVERRRKRDRLSTPLPQEQR